MYSFSRKFFSTLVLISMVGGILPSSIFADSSFFARTGGGPRSMVIDGSGNLYTVNDGSSTVTKITPDGTSSPFGTTGNYPRAITIDADGNVYTVGYYDTTITKTTPDGNSSTFGNIPQYSIDMTIDSDKNIYVISNAGYDVTKVTQDGTSSPFGPTGAQIWGITVDTNGNVYTANGDNTVTKITPDGTASPFGTTGSNPQAITIDESGNIYTANTGDNTVTKITPDGSGMILGTTGAYPNAITVDNNGNVYTANTNDRNVTKITPEGVSSIFGNTGNNSQGIVVDGSGNVYITNGASMISKITPHNPTPVVLLNGRDYEFLLLGQDTYNEEGAYWIDDTGTGDILTPTSGSVNDTQTGRYILTYSHTDNSGATYNSTRTIDVQNAGSVDSISTSNPSPALHGNFYLTYYNYLRLTVTVDGNDYEGTVNPDGTWDLPAGTISPDLTVGDHTVDLSFQVCGDGCEPPYPTVNGTLTITEPQPIDLSLTKTLTNTGVIHAGDQVGYRFTITNNNTGSTYTSLANDDNIDFEDAMPDIIDMGSGTSDTPSHVSIDNPVMYCQNYGSFANEYDPSLYGDYQNTHDIYCSLNNDLTIAPGASMSFTMTGTATADFQDGLTNKALWMDWSDPSLPLSDPDMQAIQDAFNAASNSGTPINGDMFGFSGNNVATSVYHVNTVVDTIPPVVTLNGSNLLNLFIGDTFTDPGASWTDDVDGSGTLANASSGSVDTSLSGTYILTYSYTDTSGNTGSTTRTVNVNPVAILPSTSSPQQSGPGGGGGNFTPSGGLSGNPISLISAPFGSPISLGTSSPGVTLSTNKKIKKSKDQLRLSHKIRGLSKNTPDNHTPSDDTSSLIVPTICTSILKLHNLSDIKATDIGYDEFRSSIQKLMMYRGDWTKASGVLPDAEDGIIANTNFFHGTQNITRAEYVTMLVRALGCTYEPGKNTFIPFPDVDLSLTSALYIEYAVSQHWVNGYADGDFRPDAPISRGEAAKILGNAIYLSTHQLDDNLSLVSGNSFQDISLNNEFAKYIYALKQGGILDGKSPSLFGVDDPISRQEVAKIFANVFLGSVQ